MIVFEPLDDAEALVWVKAHFGSSFVRTVSRSKYTATVTAIKEGGAEEEVVVSLPRKYK